ncbi:MAG: hypothetical protein IPO88_09915 [Nannocystis sp.]|uniref:hypothetical protein n=1 Tax=Nannocystis sp. TaxID=1962667 RepID=UPI00242241FB|nr:hypothetical protein [Nannocystis sp.]MBK9753803.1 hypothetical protein [Nannocystis sp.]
MNSAEVQGNHTWGKFSAFRVLGDHEPMPGFRLVMQFAPRPEGLTRLLEQRARHSDTLDSELARLTVRAGIGLLQSHNVSFAYANAEEVVALIRPDAVARMGSSLAVYEQLLSMYSARLAVLLGEELHVHGHIFEFPDLGIARRAFVAAQEWAEEGTPLRSARRLGSQLRGQGQGFHAGSIDTVEGQMTTLRGAGVDLDALPHWWWRGIAARFRSDGGVELYDDVPHGAELAALVSDV